MKNFNPNLYTILGRFSENATLQELKQAYRTLAKLYHPDKNPDDKVSAAEKMSELNEAYEILSNSEKRAAYNAELLAHNEALRKAEAEKKRIKEAELRRKQQEAERAKNSVSYNSHSQQKKQTSSSSSGAGLVGVALGLVALGLLIDALSDND
jgi:curved DNA-binding protein CbpA